jgi:superfamily II DNA or RNA helicase
MLVFKTPGAQVVSHALPLHTGAVSIFPYSPEIEGRFTFKTPFDEIVYGAEKSIGSKTLIVPREAVPYAPPPNDFRVSYPLAAINCNVAFRAGQEVVCQQSVNYLKMGRCHIVESPTGSGKTIMGSYIACQLGQPTIILVNKEDLVEQWLDALVNVLKIPAHLIGRVQQDTCEWKGKQFVIGMVHSIIIPGRYPEAMYQYFGMLILDEVHTMATECFIRSCQMFPAKYRLGLSATPDRKDGKTKLLHWHVGPTLVRGKIEVMAPKVLVKQTGWGIPLVRKKVDEGYVMVPLPHQPGRMMSVIKAMAASEYRNHEIVNFVVQSYKADRNCLILSDLREFHLDRLFQMLTNAGIPGNHIGYYVGQMSKIQLELSKVKKVILGTFKMVSTGTNVPAWDTLVLATPRADVKQPVGRVLRVVAHKRTPVVLDLVDKDAIFQNFHLSRKKQYHEMKAQIVSV